MSSPDPPRRKLPSITEEMAPGAVHEPRPSQHEIETVPPPPPMWRDPPKNLRRSSARLPVVSNPPPPELEPDAEQARYAAEHARAERLAAELAAIKRPPVVEAPAGPSERAIRKAQLHAAIIKVLLALAASLGAVTTYLAVHSATVLPPRVENNEIKTKVVETANDADHAALLALKEWIRTEQDRRDCIDGQMAAALARGTGHRISGPANSVEWVESNMPTRRPTLLWDRAIWFPASPCAAPTRMP